MLSEEKIIQHCQAKQMQYMDILFNRYQKPLYSFCCKLSNCEADAENLFQDTWLKAMKEISRYSSKGKFLSWLFAICINTHRDRHRKYKRWLKRIVNLGSADSESLAFDALTINENQGFEGKLLMHEQESYLRTALTKLNENHKLPILLYYYREFSIAEIAEILVIPEGTVKSRLANGRAQIKLMLKGVIDE